MRWENCQLIISNYVLTEIIFNYLQYLLMIPSRKRPKKPEFELLWHSMTKEVIHLNSEVLDNEIQFDKIILRATGRDWKQCRPGQCRFERSWEDDGWDGQMLRIIRLAMQQVKA